MGSGEKVNVSDATPKTAVEMSIAAVRVIGTVTSFKVPFSVTAFYVAAQICSTVTRIRDMDAVLFRGAVP